MFRRLAAARILPAFFTVLCLAGVSYAQTAPDTQKTLYAPEPAPLADSDPESLVNFRFSPAQNVWIQPHIFICAGMTSQRTWKGSTETGVYWSKEAYLKNGRISIDAQITHLFTLFYQTDDLSINSEYKGGFTQTYGKKSNAAYIKDAYLHFNPAAQFQVYAGLLTVPINRANMMSDTGLLGVDNTSMHPQFGKFSNSGRDTGIMLRGILLKSILEYRFGVFQGLTKETNTNSAGTAITRNSSNSPRITGRLQVNGMDAEEGYFCNENYMSKRELLSFGLGVDYQQNIFHSGKDYMSWAVDVPMNIQMQGIYTFCAQASIIYAQNYPDFTGQTYNGYLSTNFQAGVLVADTYEPLVKYTFGSTYGDSKEYKTLTAGFNYYIDGNRMNLKSSFDMPVGKNKHYPDQWKGTLQFQLYM